MADMRLVLQASNLKRGKSGLCEECGMPMTNCCCG